ncbi:MULTISPECIES: bifunctional DNA primase/polymerase [Cryobacterium]|uniref:bifunctional DNA primase/polymerase n=1 Tax=Cryobacterium TaxID=69578 RepID=UPI000CD4725D|nr:MULTISPECIES: bifunctional DNA primase/polymerase [Cryobacterium]POH66075.1 DNA primase [Cryobacterium zongtaii]TFC46742.1 bifunctional DNA primase/polymerase [Cryobacterium sp. TMN-39-2]
MDIVDVLLDTSRSSVGSAALSFARAAIPIFPCARDGKRPLTHVGFHEASSDLDQVQAWWARWPSANIGMPTGGPSGFDVVDIDVTAAGSGYIAYERASVAGLVDGELARVRTPSSGMHVYFPALAARPQRCWQAASAHIDFRGDGGYVVVPPSMLATPNGRFSYRLNSLSAAGSKPVDAIALREFLAPRPPQAVSRPEVLTSAEPQRLAQWVSKLAEGERNRGLFWAACRLVEAGFAPADIDAALAPAALSAGLPTAEITATIRSASRQAAPHTPGAQSEQWCDPRAQVRGRGDAPCLG